LGNDTRGGELYEKPDVQSLTSHVSYPHLQNILLIDTLVEMVRDTDDSQVRETYANALSTASHYGGVLSVLNEELGKRQKSEPLSEYARRGSAAIMMLQVEMQNHLGDTGMQNLKERIAGDELRKDIFTSFAESETALGELQAKFEGIEKAKEESQRRG
jgi:hypothetical protein